MSIKPIVAWYDFWVGLFWDAGKRRLYVFPVPMLGLMIQFKKPSPYNDGYVEGPLRAVYNPHTGEVEL